MTLSLSDIQLQNSLQSALRMGWYFTEAWILISPVEVQTDFLVNNENWSQAEPAFAVNHEGIPSITTKI